MNQTVDPIGPAGESSPLQLELLALMGSYKDLYCSDICPVVQAPQVCSAYCLHILNHVLKANSRVLAHNALLREHKTQAAPGAEPQDEPRDQGLTRPKVKYWLRCFVLLNIPPSDISSLLQLQIRPVLAPKQPRAAIGPPLCCNGCY